MVDCSLARDFEDEVERARIGMEESELRGRARRSVLEVDVRQAMV